MPCAPCSHIVCPQKRAVALNASPKNPAGRSVARRDTSELLNPDLDEMQLDDAYYAEIGMTREEAMRQQKEMLYNIDPDAMLLDDIGKVDESLPEEWRNAIESLEVYGPQVQLSVWGSEFFIKRGMHCCLCFQESIHQHEAAVCMILL